MLYTLAYRDARERQHVMLADVATPEEMLQKVVAYQEDRNGFYREPTLDDVQAVEFDEQDGGLALLYHADYD